MEKKEFLKFTANTFRENGFYRKGTNYYREYGDDIIVVFSFFKSSYGSYFYAEYGLAFKSINKHLPYPKYNELDINFGRIMTSFGKAIKYENITEEELNDFSSTIKNYVDHILSIVEKGKKEIVRQCIDTSPPVVEYVLKETPSFLGLSADLFKDKGIAVIDF